MVQARSSDDSPDCVFETKDPDRILVTLNRRRWEEHISVRHPEVSDFKQIQRVVENPHLIVMDPENRREHHFYALGIQPFPKLYLHVPVVYHRSGGQKIGEVKTAYFVNARRLIEGKIRWLKPPSER